MSAPHDVCSLSDFKCNTSEFIRRLKATGRPLMLTVDGKSELVVQDAASYQRLLDLARRAERADALRASIADMQAGRVEPAEEMLAEMRRLLDEAERC